MSGGVLFLAVNVFDQHVFAVYKAFKPNERVRIDRLIVSLRDDAFGGFRNVEIGNVDIFKQNGSILANGIMVREGNGIETELPVDIADGYVAKRFAARKQANARVAVIAINAVDVDVLILVRCHPTSPQ